MISTPQRSRRDNPRWAADSAIDVDHPRQARYYAQLVRLGVSNPLPVVLTLEDTGRKLEASAEEALTVLGQLMWPGQEDTIKVSAACAVLRAWQKSLRAA